MERHRLNYARPREGGRDVVTGVASGLVAAAWALVWIVVASVAFVYVLREAVSRGGWEGWASCGVLGVLVVMVVSGAIGVVVAAWRRVLGVGPMADAEDEDASAEDAEVG